MARTRFRLLSLTLCLLAARGAAASAASGATSGAPGAQTTVGAAWNAEGAPAVVAPFSAAAQQAAPVVPQAVAQGAAPATRAGDVPCPTSDCDPARLQRRSLTAVRVSGPSPVIDGRLDDAAWALAPVATDFVESRPRQASPAALRSEARVVVDDEAIYIALTYYDDAPDRIVAPLARRDDETTSDWAFVEIDSRHDRRSAFSFGVNPRGVQVDGLWMNDVQWDVSWNAVWQSAGHIDEQGWTAEFRIPFSQLAFSLPGDARELVWGINFYRNNPYRGNASNWSPRYRSRSGIVSNFNDLRVPAPSRVTRLELTPYVAPRAGGGTHDEAGRASARAGADVKIGLGSSASLTATVLPDFGQVEADPSQVNLSAFELFQDERRPFFLEGLDLFRLDTSLAFASRDVSFAEESPFYSRRIGRAPRGTAPAGLTPLSTPVETTLLGAAKLSGQTSGGWTLGLFTSISGRETTRAQAATGDVRTIPVEPRASVTVGRAIRNFRRGESSLGLFVANLHRYGLGAESSGAESSAATSSPAVSSATSAAPGALSDDSLLASGTADAPTLATQFARDQTVVGLDVLHRFANRGYELRGWMLGSRLAGDPDAVARVLESPQHYFQRPDAPGRWRDAFGASSLDGGAGQLRLSRIAGALRWDVIGHAVSPGFDVNELGFQRNADWLLLSARWQYDRFRAGHWIRAWTVGSDNVGAGWSWSGDPRARVVNGYATIDWRNYWSLRVAAAHAWSTMSMERLRGGPALRLPGRHDLSLTLGTDSRRVSFATLDASVSRERGSGSWSAAVSPLVNIRSANWLQWSVGPSYAVEVVGWQSVGRLTTSAMPAALSLLSVPLASPDMPRHVITAHTEMYDDATAVPAPSSPRLPPASSTAGLAVTSGRLADEDLVRAVADHVGQPLIAAVPSASTHDIIGRVTQRTLSLTMRGDLTFSPRLALQVYVQPFGTVGRYDRFQRVIAPRATNAADRVTPVSVLRDSASAAAVTALPGGAAAGSVATGSAATDSMLRLDLDGDGRVEGSLLSPSGQARALMGTVVLRWEYRPGSFLTFAWNHRRAAATPDASRSVGQAFAALLGDSSTNVVLLKASFRLGR